eukprot:m.19236 g.19236  ORF g.19236 m.19236 type:complete len:121 (+) comp27811_c0_seq8:1343-1705(+)
MVNKIVQQMVDLSLSIEELVALEEFAFLNPDDRSELASCRKLQTLSFAPEPILKFCGPPLEKGDRRHKILRMLNDDVKPVAQSFMKCVQIAKEDPRLQQYCQQMKGLDKVIQSAYIKNSF